MIHLPPYLVHWLGDTISAYHAQPQDMDLAAQYPSGYYHTFLLSAHWGLNNAMASILKKFSNAIFLKGNFWILIKIMLDFVPKDVFGSWYTEILCTPVHWQQGTTKLVEKFGSVRRGSEPWTTHMKAAIVLHPFVIGHRTNWSTEPWIKIQVQTVCSLGWTLSGGLFQYKYVVLPV